MDDFPTLTLNYLLDRSVAHHGARPALSMVHGEPLTYAQLGEQVRSLSAMLADRGIGHGDRMAILAESCPHWGVAYLAVTTMGATAVPILPEFHSTFARLQKLIEQPKEFEKTPTKKIKRYLYVN